MSEKTGVFICTGYGIAEALDIEALCKVVEEECEVPYCKTVESCEGSGLQEICREIEAQGLERVVIAGVSPRAYDDHLLPSNVLIEKVALREHVVWCQPPEDEDTQMLAEDYLRMYLAKVEKTSLAEPYQPEEELSKVVLVVGGGVTGMTAAKEAAEAGYPVKLVEKTGRLGGWLGRQHKSFPTSAPFRELEDPGIDELRSAVESNPLIDVFTSASTSSITGAPGLFDVALSSTAEGNGNGQELAHFRVGSIVQATGWQPTDPLASLPYGELPDVILSVELEEMFRESGKITRPSDGAEAKSIAFIQCGGDAHAEERPYCSSICCMTSLKQALYLTEGAEDAKAYIFYEFMRTPGQYEDFYRRAQEESAVFLTRGKVEEVQQGPDGKLHLKAADTMPGGELEVAVDLVVVAAGMRPNAADGEAIRAYEDAKLATTNAESDNLREEAAKKAEELSAHAGTQILNLEYRQGPDLPTLEQEFPDSHFICFPYESRRTGIYPAGAVRQPMDGSASRNDATGAALKAIQCMEMAGRGEAVHPRARDLTYPDFFFQRCTQCKRCTEECPFGVLNEDEKGTPLPNPTRCRRCGICMGACPERIVSFADYSVDIISSMIKAVDVPDEFEEKPRVLAFMCENDAFPALDAVGKHRLPLSPFVRVIPVRCLGSVNSVWITDALAAGFDGILSFGCKHGDDYQCHFIKGSELADYRANNIKKTLEQMQLESERAAVHQVQITDYAEIPKIVDEFMEMIERVGMNPFKGM